MKSHLSAVVVITAYEAPPSGFLAVQRVITCGMPGFAFEQSSFASLNAQNALWISPTQRMNEDSWKKDARLRTDRG
jgi:hypothetical protein